MASKKSKTVEEEKTFHGELLSQMITLSTSGFGLVAALAWNEAIQTFVKEFIEPKVPGTGLFYKFLYAVIVTCLIVIITYQLSRIAARFQQGKK